MNGDERKEILQSARTFLLAMNLGGRGRSGDDPLIQKGKPPHVVWSRARCVRGAMRAVTEKLKLHTEAVDQEKIIGISAVRSI